MIKNRKQFKHRSSCRNGRKVAIYIYRHKEWLKLGLYCNRCGVIQIRSKFEKGLAK